MKKLKGPKGSFVTLGLLRYGEDELVKVKIRRDDILVESIEAAYLIDKKWGYVQIQRFAENTYMEFLQSLLILAQDNPQGLIIDLRGNGGGYMAVALEMANQFLEEDDVIVYTEGANAPTSIERANGYGLFKEIPLVILVDETSASASEIIAGTVQDNDRGTIIGRRTFGKGLVQQQIPLDDGSLMRLTIARYHTPYRSPTPMETPKVMRRTSLTDSTVASSSHRTAYTRTRNLSTPPRADAQSLAEEA